MNNYLTNFSLDYQDKIGRYRRWQDAQLSLLGRALLIKGLENQSINFVESELKYTPYNKPYFDNINLQFNISHSGEVVVCALSNLGDVGIDIEKINSINIESFKSQMTNYEWDKIHNSEDIKQSFFKYWSQKEAVIKAHGNGLSIPLKSFEIKNNRTTIDTEEFYLKEIEMTNEYSCHLALKNNLETIGIKTYKIDF